ncbi:MAG: hypothetical protein F2659_04050 [Actinobacteria bacterium]|uniref:Unannotated protein n=1 Tax=freshwater metagenome TaxID=449393 RepID=A0A6J6P6P3_9ZZZZ|nr:hypothetical protein [Actinomycetota bacterium]
MLPQPGGGPITRQEYGETAWKSWLDVSKNYADDWKQQHVPQDQLDRDSIARPGGHTDMCWARPDLCTAEPGASGLGIDAEVALIGAVEAMSPDDFYKLELNPDEIDKRGVGFLNWSNDGCSSSPDGIGGASFLGACARHDFSYRNRSAWEDATGQNIFSKDARRAADDRLAQGLYDACDLTCDGAAPIYWTFVHGYGDGAFPNILPWDGWLPGFGF